MIPADLIDEVSERALQKLRDMVPEIARRMTRPDGSTYGDVEMTRGQRIQRIVDMSQRGSFDCLANTVKPELAQRMHSQYLRDMQAGPLTGGE